MTLLECFIRESVFLDVGADVIYSEDTIIAERPERFPTVEVRLISTVFLTDVSVKKNISAFLSHIGIYKLIGLFK